jgi:surfactin synthase thioesterase subunit
MRLLCLPFAGAGASFFRPWSRLGVEGVEVVPVQLPGRERRIAEPLYQDVHEAADGLLPEVLADLPDPAEPVALFGHSLGAVLAYELAHRLVDAGRPVHRLFVSGSPGPGAERTERASDLDEESFVAQVEKFAGYRHPAFDDPEMRALLLPTLYADVRMHESYRPRAAKPLPVPITAIRAADDGLVSAAESAHWREATSAEFVAVEVPSGGHMYLTADGRVVLDIVAASLAGGTVPANAAH